MHVQAGTRLLSALVVFSSAASRLDAQSATLDATMPITVEARLEPLRSRTYSIPAGPITSSEFRRASLDNVVFADTRITPLPLGVSWQVSADADFILPPGYYQAAADTDGPRVILSLRNLPPGRLVVDISASATPTSTARASVDLGNDGTPEVVVSANAVCRSFVVSGPSLDVAISARAQATAWAGIAPRSANVDLQIEFVPDGAVELTSYGPTCGPTLLGAHRFDGRLHALAFAVQHGQANALAAFVLGDDRADLPLPPCRLLVVPATVFLRSTDTGGAAVLTFVFPGPVPPGVVYLQAITFDTSTLQTSQGLRVEFRSGDC